jgi:hypothetical protein
MHLLHLSPVYLGEVKWMDPRIPYGRAQLEDSTTPRVCFSRSISGCMKAIADPMGDLYCYALDSLSVMFIPRGIPNSQGDWKAWKNYTSSKSELFRGMVCDAGVTGEVWALERVRLAIVGIVHMGDNGWEWGDIYCAEAAAAAQNQDQI